MEENFERQQRLLNILLNNEVLLTEWLRFLVFNSLSVEDSTELKHPVLARDILEIPKHALINAILQLPNADIQFFEEIDDRDFPINIEEFLLAFSIEFKSNELNSIGA